MNTELQNQVRQILLKELKPGGMLYAILERGLDKGQSQSIEQINAKLECEKDKDRTKLLEYMIDRESIIRREYQQKYETALLGLVDLVERFGGDSGAMMNWDSAEFVKSAKPEEVIENVYKTLKELEKNTEKQVACGLANRLTKSAKSGKITIYSVISELKKYLPNKNITLLDGELVIAENS